MDARRESILVRKCHRHRECRIASIAMPRWLRIVLVAGVVILVTGAGFSLIAGIPARRR
jgi:hypothetical protein